MSSSAAGAIGAIRDEIWRMMEPYLPFLADVTATSGGAVTIQPHDESAPHGQAYARAAGFRLAVGDVVRCQRLVGTPDIPGEIVVIGRVTDTDTGDTAVSTLAIKTTNTNALRIADDADARLARFDTTAKLLHMYNGVYLRLYSDDGATAKFIAEGATGNVTILGTLTQGGATVDNQTAADARYVNVSGDSMTGALTIKTTNANALNIAKADGIVRFNVETSGAIAYVDALLQSQVRGWDNAGQLRMTLDYAGLTLGGSTATMDAVLNRLSANTLSTPDMFVATGGLRTKVKAGAITDADFVNDGDGNFAVNTANGSWQYRSGGVWRGINPDDYVLANGETRDVTFSGSGGITTSPTGIVNAGILQQGGASVNSLFVNEAGDSMAGYLTVGGLITANGGVLIGTGDTLDFGNGITLTRVGTDLNQNGSFTQANGEITTSGSVIIGGNLDHNGGGIGFFNATVIAKQTVTGARGSNGALTSLLTTLSNYGLIINSTTT